jgi:hypothetical protein
MFRVFGVMLLIASGAFAWGSPKPQPQPRPKPQATAVPEIGGASAASAVALLAGTLLTIRGRRKKQSLKFTA